MARGRRLGRKRPAAPERRCVACRAVRAQGDLLRLTAVGGRVVADTTRTLGGRGCWICRSAACAHEASKGRKVSRALKGRAGEPEPERLLAWVQGPAGLLDGGKAGG